MNYRHIYHAGSFADVFKHGLLVGLIQALSRKEKPFCYLETHAGVGKYDLHRTEAQKTYEYQNGIAKLWAIPPETCPSPFSEYLKQVHSINPTAALQFYPGSPFLVQNLLRPQDKMILCELHPEDALTLRGHFRHQPQIAVHHLDGYTGLKALLPPPIPRGLVFIDPPFEKPDEFDTLLKLLPAALKRWNTGSFAIWYPIKNRSAVNLFYKELKAAEIPETLRVEFSLPKSEGLSASGMLVIRPPWQWEKEAKAGLEWLGKRLGGDFCLEWLG